MQLTVVKTFGNNVELAEVGLMLAQLGAQDPEVNSLCEGFFAITHTLSEDSPVTGKLIKLVLGEAVRYEVHALLGSLEVVLAPVTKTSFDFAKAVQAEKHDAQKWQALINASEKDKVRFFLNDKPRGYWGSVESEEDHKRFHQYIEHEVADTNFGEYGRRLGVALKEAIDNGDVPPMKDLRPGKKPE